MTTQFLPEHVLFDVDYSLISRVNYLIRKKEERNQYQREYYQRDWKKKVLAAREKYRLKRLREGYVVNPLPASRYF